MTMFVQRNWRLVSFLRRRRLVQTDHAETLATIKNLHCYNASATSRQLSFDTKKPNDKKKDANDDVYANDRINAMIGHNFPDFIEHWDRTVFRKVGYGLSAVTLAAVAGPSVFWGVGATTMVV